MSAIKVRKDYFSGHSKVFDAGPDALGNIIRGLAIDNARNRIEAAAVADWTDNSTGTAAAALVAMPLPSAAIDATSAGGAQTTALNTSIGNTNNAFQVIKNSLNNARSRLGLPLVVFAYGTQAAADTIPAQDLTATAASGTSAAKYSTVLTQLTVVRNNFLKLASAFNEVLVALGEVPLALPVAPWGAGITLGNPGSATSVAAGPGAVAKADVDPFLAAVANNIATLAATWNRYMTQGGTIAALTDSSGGTAAAGLVANVAPAAAVDGAATTSAPKAGFDTQLNLIEEAISELAAKLNPLLGEYNITLLTDSTGQTPDGTISALAATLSAVDGSSGTVALDFTTAVARMGTINNALSSIAAKFNLLAPTFGVDTVADALGGTVSNTLANIAATGTGVGGAASTILNTVAQTWISTNRDNIATLAAAVNKILGANQTYKPLHVVAG